MPDQFKLTNDEQRALQQMNPDLAAARDTIAKLEAMGIDVTEQKDRLERASTIRTGFLREFSNPLTTR